MWRKFITTVSLSCLVGISVVPVATAQVGGDDDELLKAESREKYLEKVKKMSPAQRKDKSIKRINKMKKSEGRVTGLRDEAREKGEEISKLNCINDKLSLIKGHVNLSEKAYIAMDEGEQKSDMNSVSHHYTLIAVSAGKVSNLEDEALLCVGKSLNIDDSGASGAIESEDIVKVDPVLPGGYTQLEDIFGDIYDTTGLTPIR